MLIFHVFTMYILHICKIYAFEYFQIYILYPKNLLEFQMNSKWH